MKFEFMRDMIVQRLRKFPQKYKRKEKKFSKYCDSMAKNGEPGSSLELQVIADICFSVVECYSTANAFVPVHKIWPLRLLQCKGCIRLWMQDGHCLALVNVQSRPPVRNIFEENEVAYSLDEEEKDGGDKGRVPENPQNYS